MSIWAIGDLHLSFSNPAKSMAKFGWGQYEEKIATSWKENISSDDLVLIPGDISWATYLPNALIDLEWIDALPGTKVLIRGNHDYWWPSQAKLQKVLPPSLKALYTDSFVWQGVAIGGARLWDSPEYSFGRYVDIKGSLSPPPTEEDLEKSQKIFERELSRLEISLRSLPKNARVKIAMTHYPPIGADLSPSRTSTLLESYGIDIALFGHLHSLKEDSPPFTHGSQARGVRYLCTSCDFLQFTPIRVL